MKMPFSASGPRDRKFNRQKRRAIPKAQLFDANNQPVPPGSIGKKKPMISMKFTAAWPGEIYLLETTVTNHVEIGV